MVAALADAVRRVEDEPARHSGGVAGDAVRAPGSAARSSGRPARASTGPVHAAAAGVAGDAGDQRPERRRRVLGEVALAVRQRGAEVAGDGQGDQRHDEPGAHDRIAGPGPLAAPCRDRGQERADRDADAELQMALEGGAPVAAGRAEQVAGAAAIVAAPRREHEQRQPRRGDPRRRRAAAARHDSDGARQKQERDREVDEQRMEAAGEGGPGTRSRHASRSLTTWPCTSVSR